MKLLAVKDISRSWSTGNQVYTDRVSFAEIDGYEYLTVDDFIFSITYFAAYSYGPGGVNSGQVDMSKSYDNSTGVLTITSAGRTSGAGMAWNAKIYCIRGLSNT